MKYRTSERLENKRASVQWLNTPDNESAIAQHPLICRALSAQLEEKIHGKIVCPGRPDLTSITLRRITPANRFCNQHWGYPGMSGLCPGVRAPSDYARIALATCLQAGVPFGT
jgi:hypothetical protein